MTSLLRRSIAPVLLLALLTLPAAPAHAGAETLKRAVGNILFAPFDLALAPVVAGDTVYDNLRSSDDTMPVKIAYPLPGYVWVTAVQGGASVIRAVTGAIEIVPGAALVFVDNEIDPLFDPVERSQALVDMGGDTFPVKFGIDYTSLPGYY